MSKDSIGNVLAFQQELIQELIDYGLELKKFTINFPTMLEKVDPTNRCENAVA